MGRLRIEHDDQLSEGICADCGAPYRSVIGVVYEDRDAVAIYRADLFDRWHRSDEPRVMLSIAVGDWSDGSKGADRCSASIEAWGVRDEVHMVFSARSGSPWPEMGVSGWQLTPSEALTSPLRDAFYRLADHIAQSDHRLRKTLTVKSAAG